MLVGRWRIGQRGARGVEKYASYARVSARCFSSTTVSWRRSDRQHSQEPVITAIKSPTTYKPDFRARASSKYEQLKHFEASGHLRISEEVRAALAAKLPVVALESTIYTHGLPYPENIALAIELEGILRNNGVVPATIGFLDGVATIGLSPTELSVLSSSTGSADTMKVSRRDMPYIIGMVTHLTLWTYQC